MPFPSRGLRKLAGLPDHLIRLEEEGWGNRDAEGLGSLEVDDQLKFHGLLDGQIGRFGTLQNLADEHGGAAPVVSKARPIGHEATSLWRAGRCWGNRESPVVWLVLFTYHSNPEKPPFACQTATRHVSR